MKDRTLKGLLLEVRLGEYEMQILAAETIINMFTDVQAENLILKKKLEACKKQRNAETWQPFDGEGSKAAIEAYDKELESIS